MISAGEILIGVGAIVLIFGASRLPKIGRSIGQGIRELKKGMNEVDSPEENESKESVDPKTTDEEK
jgi:sec-independent protein translocase protein TatA